MGYNVAIDTIGKLSFSYIPNLRIRLLNETAQLLVSTNINSRLVNSTEDLIKKRLKIKSWVRYHYDTATTSNDTATTSFFLILACAVSPHICLIATANRRHSIR